MTKIERLDSCRKMADTLPNVPEEAKAMISRLIVESFELATNFTPVLAIKVMYSCIAACLEMKWTKDN